MVNCTIAESNENISRIKVEYDMLNSVSSGYGSASHDGVRIKRWVCHSSGTIVVAFTSAVAIHNVFQFSSHIGNLRFGSTGVLQCRFTFGFRFRLQG